MVIISHPKSKIAHIIILRYACVNKDEAIEQVLQSLPKVYYFIRHEARKYKAIKKIGDVPSVLRPKDIKDPINLVSKLRKAKDPISKYLREQFSSDLQFQLEGSDNFDSSSQSPFITALVKEFNQLLKNPHLFEAQHIAQIKLKKKTRNVIEQAAQEDIVYRNRLLLEDAYPHEIARRQKSIKKGDLLEINIIHFTTLWLIETLIKPDGYCRQVELEKVFLWKNVGKESTFYEATTRLDAVGLIEQKRQPDEDRRKNLISLTQSGRDLLEELRVIRKINFESILEDFESILTTLGLKVEEVYEILVPMFNQLAESVWTRIQEEALQDTTPANNLQDEE